MPKYIYAAMLSVTLLLTACGLTTRELISDKNKAEKTTLYVVSNKGLSISNDGGNKWDRLIPGDQYNKETVLQLVPLKTGFQLLTSGGLYTYNEQMTRNLTVSVNQGLFTTDGWLLDIADKGLLLLNSKNQWTTLNTQALPNFAYYDDKYLLGAKGSQLFLNKDGAWIQLTEETSTINQVLCQKQKIYYGTAQGITVATLDKDQKLSDKKLIKLPEKQIPLVWNIDQRGAIYLAGKNNFARSLSGEIWDSFSEETGYIPCLPVDIQAYNPEIYQATDRGLVYSLNGGETWHKLTKAHGLLEDNLQKVFVQKK
jgi:hypothetical protein